MYINIKKFRDKKTEMWEHLRNSMYLLKHQL